MRTVTVVETGPLCVGPWWPDGLQCAYGCAALATHVVIERDRVRPPQRWPACAEHAAEAKAGAA